MLCDIYYVINLVYTKSDNIIFSRYSTDYYDIQYPGVILRIFLERKIQYHLLQTYIPSGLFVIIAWLAIFISPEAIPGRVSMVMMSLLTLMAMFGSVRQNTPKVGDHILLVRAVLRIFRARAKSRSGPPKLIQQLIQKLK